MKSTSLILALCLSAAPVLAQTTAPTAPPQASPPAQSGPGNNAVNSPNTNNSNAPVSGANSFTEGQARSRLESAGFTQISDLQKDDNGVWRGKAMRGGKTVNISLDFQGNVNAN